MADVKGTSQESVEKKFKDIFGRSPGPFPEGTSLEKKVELIGKANRIIEAQKKAVLEKRFEDIARNNKVIKMMENAPSVPSEEPGGKPLTEKEIAKASIHTDKHPSKIEGLHDNKEFQEETNTPRKATTKDKIFEHNTQKKTTEASVQTDTQPSKHDVSPSVSKSSVKEKLNTEPDKKDNTPQPQENQKEEGLFSLLKRFVKKILEKLLGEDEKSVENARGIKEDAQRDTSNNEKQQKSMDQSSFININGKRFDLEPEKAFNYQDKAFNISIIPIPITRQTDGQ